MSISTREFDLHEKPKLIQAWSIISQECGAPLEMGVQFIAYAREYSDWTEWRFQGKLGFGGKLWQTHWPEHKFYVTCYQEDETPERLEMIERANQQLKELG